MPSSIPASAMSDPARAAAPRGSGFWADTLHRVVRNRAAVAGGTVVVLFIAVALFAPVLSPYDPLKGRLGERLRAPSGAHWLGTDELGRDVLSRVLHGARITVQIQLAAVGLALAVGAALGLAAGYIGRWVDQLIMRLMDILMAFPGIFLALAIIAALGTVLGLGVQPPSPEWGAMLSNARSYMITAPHVAMIPGLAIALVVLGFNLLGDGLRDSLDPRLRE